MVYSSTEYERTIEAIRQVFDLTNEDIRSAEQSPLVRDGYTLTITFNRSKKKQRNTKDTPFVEIIIKTDSGDIVQQNLHYGLMILATEKHDSRRIDNQLRGRAGRQGDAGVSMFFVALDDEIMRKV